jgi:hypothetical protein
MAALAALCLSAPPLSAQTLARRLILKDGSYQAITKYEIHGERVRYFSAERGEWEEVPKSLVDWNATEKYEQGRVTGAPVPEAAELDKELEAERKAAEARSPQVAPGLRLSDEGGVYLLDTYQNQPQLAEIGQSGSDLNRSLKSNILRSTINPLAGARQTIDTLGMLADKTKGNLTPREQGFLQNCLYELRMAYVEVTNALARGPQTPTPNAGNK